MKVPVKKNVRFVMHRGDRASVRVATPEQQREYGLDKGEPVVRVQRVGGRVELYVGRDTSFIVQQYRLSAPAVAAKADQ
jgi:hypothetical protein